MTYRNILGILNDNLCVIYICINYSIYIEYMLYCICSMYALWYIYIPHTKIKVLEMCYSNWKKLAKIFKHKSSYNKAGARGILQE